MKPTYISWHSHCSRSDHTARELGGTSHMVYWGVFGSNILTAWLKYLAQAASTFRVLRAELPDVVFVMAPPLPAVLTVWLWCRLRGIPFVVDGHTGAFLHPNWRRLQWLQNAVCRLAATTIVTNEHLAGKLREAGVHVTIIRDVPVTYDVTDAFQPEGGFSVAVVCSFNEDEPIGDILSAASQIHDVRFYLTGNPTRMTHASALPPNVTLTGFLPNAAYGSLLTNVDVVMALTTRDHTMLRGAYESVYQGTPVIVSDWPLLRDAFSRGAIHVDNSADAIVAAIRQMRAQHDDFRAGARALREEKYQAWQASKRALLNRVRLRLDSTVRVADSEAR